MSKVPEVTLFILTRPLGAVIGDFLDKPISAGGLALSRYRLSPGRAARVAHPATA
jgi:uncharacterized membrane-anchored protein